MLEWPSISRVALETQAQSRPNGPGTRVRAHTSTVYRSSLQPALCPHLPGDVSGSEETTRSLFE